MNASAQNPVQRDVMEYDVVIVGGGPVPVPVTLPATTSFHQDFGVAACDSIPLPTGFSIAGVVFLDADGGVEMHEAAKTVDTPLSQLPYEQLCPGSEALDKLEQQDQRLASLVKLRFFAGLTIEQAAKALGISTTTADSDWAYARAWLYEELKRTL